MLFFLAMATLLPDTNYDEEEVEVWLSEQLRTRAGEYSVEERLTCASTIDLPQPSTLPSQHLAHNLECQQQAPQRRARAGNLVWRGC